MRRITLVLALFALIFSANAQEEIMKANRQLENAAVKRFTPAEWQKEMSSRAYGDVIWEENFGGGAIPAGWINVDNSSLNHVWIWSDAANPAQSNTYSTNTAPFASTTGANGYIVLPGDHYNTPLPAAANDMDAYFITTAINCDTATSVMLKFEHFFRFCCGGDQVMEVSVSNNNVDWTTFDVSMGVETNATSENPEVVRINITPIAAGESTVYIKFYIAEVSHYYWAIDDIQLITAPANNIEFAEVYHTHYDDTWGVTGSYSRVPLSQKMSIYSAANILNYGDVTQTDVTLETTIFDGTGTQIFNETADTSQLSFGDTAYVEIATQFVLPAVADVYTVANTCYSAQTDEVPDNNFIDTIDFEITENRIFSRDRQYPRWAGDRVSTDYYTGSVDGDFLGVEYFIPNNDTVHSISVYIDYRSTPGSVIVGKIYREESTPIDIIESEEYIVQKKDIGTWVTLPMVAYNPGDDLLEGGRNYYAGIDCYLNGETLEIGSEPEDYPHLFSFESKLLLGSSWYWIHDLPYIRLNLTGAILPPVFTSEPQLECGINQVYDYVAEVADPQGLPVTLEALSTNPDIQLSFVDNGDGTISIATDVTPSAANLILEDRFRIRIKANNGTVVNEQYFWVYIVDVVDVEEASFDAVKIYPNPAQDVLFVDNAKNADIHVFNLLGKQVLSIKNADMQNQINIDNLSAGTYIISVVKNNEVITKKFNKI